MPTIRAQVTFQGLSNKPEDVVVNTWHFVHADYTPASQQAVADALIEFYNVATTGTPGGSAICTALSKWLSRGTLKSSVKTYDLATPKPRVPAVYPFTLGQADAATSAELPAEVALCASFYATQNLKRQRGRVYLGPWSTGYTADDTVQVERAIPTTALMNAVAGSLKRLITKPDTGPRLAVYSEMDGQARIVTNGWVDNAWDTQRRRGQDATLRTLVP